MSTFTAHEREQIRAALVDAARDDPRIAGAAHLGSLAMGRVDRWSDIDLALACDPSADMGRIVQDWTDRLYRDHDAATHFDVRFESALYRVFLLGNTLQVDVSFWPPDAFAPRGPAFQLIFGTPGERRRRRGSQPRDRRGTGRADRLLRRRRRPPSAPRGGARGDLRGARRDRDLELLLALPRRNPPVAHPLQGELPAAGA